MIKINKSKYKITLINDLIEDVSKGTYTADDLIRRLQKLKGIEYDANEFNLMKNRIINVYVEATKEFKSGTSILWKNKRIHTTKTLWKELNKIGVYRTVPLWKLDKTVEELIQTRRMQHIPKDKERRLINQLLGHKDIDHTM